MGFIIFARANSRMFNHIILLLTNNLKPINQNERGNFDYKEQCFVSMRPFDWNFLSTCCDKKYMIWITSEGYDLNDVLPKVSFTSHEC